MYTVPVGYIVVESFFYVVSAIFIVDLVRKKMYMRKIKAMFQKKQFEDVIKYSKAKYKKVLIKSYFKETIALFIVLSAIMIEDYDLAFSYIDKFSLKKSSQYKASLYMYALLLTGNNAKAEEVFSGFSNKTDPLSVSAVNEYKPYFEFLATGKPIDETFLQAIKNAIQKKIYSKISSKP